MSSLTLPVRIGLVLSCGGLRGAAHLGVLQQLQRHGIMCDVIVGVSAGAIIAGYFAAVGLTAAEMIGDAPAFRGRHLFMHGLTVWAHPRLKPVLRRFCGVIPHRLAQLADARFDRLHHGVRRLGVVCHDLAHARPAYFSTMRHHGVRLADVVKASAAVPGMLPSALVHVGGERRRLADGGISDPLPVEFARSADLGASHVIVSDCRRLGEPSSGADLIYIRPDLDGIGSFRAPRATLMAAVRAGEAAVTPSVISEIRAWRLPAEPAHLAG